jgi:medium-chain acyl-[acyl-carrier-protein] hydrolase
MRVAARRCSCAGRMNWRTALKSAPSSCRAVRHACGNRGLRGWHRSQPGLPQPGALFLSGHRAPASPNSLGQFSELPDDEFIAQIGARYGGIPPAVLADRDLLQHYLPALRADFELLGTYEYTHEAPLDCPFYAYNGLADTRVTAADLDEWRTLTTGPFQRRWFPGGHFYLQKERSAVLRCLASDLARE